MKLEQLCKILSTISQTKTLSAPLLAAKLGISPKETSKALDILLILGVIKPVKIEKKCATCPLSRLCNTTKTTTCRFYIVDIEKLQELNKRCRAWKTKQ